MQNIATKMIAVMKECSHVLKNGTNSFHSYKYATCSDVLEKVNAAFVKYGISTMAVPELIRIEKVTTSKGNEENLATVKITIMLTDSESGETMSITGLGSGQDNGDKAVMKAQTAAIKYAYLLSLAISTGDDPENEGQNHFNEPRNRNSNFQSNHAYTKSPVSTLNKSYLCEDCGAKISQKVKDYSHNKYGRSLCINCQRILKDTA